jgi:hypothetical protein
LRFLESFIELVGVADGVEGWMRGVWYLSEEQIKGAIHPRSVYRGRGIRGRRAFLYRIGSGGGCALGTDDRWWVVKWRDSVVICWISLINMHTFRMYTFTFSH